MYNHEWAKMHEDLGHRVSDYSYTCITCGQTYKQYMKEKIDEFLENNDSKEER